MKALKFVIPLAVFALLAAFLAVGLTRDPRQIPSPFIGKAAPAFRLEQLHDERLAFAPADMRGKVWLLNV
ncbi:MAG TPA: DsbE family thiol:disulfide interchange protein, partial [Usitatibacter sp.]